MKLEVRRYAGGVRSYAAVLPAAVGCGLFLTVAGCGGISRRPAPMPRSAESTYTLMQMNLCLSGLAGCYAKVDYPAGVQDAVSRIRETHPTAVTLSEACSGDVALIARQTRYHLRFAKVMYDRKPLPCIKPIGRGLFGIAVLSRAFMGSTDSRAFRTQAGPERREWLCVSIPAGVEVCTAQLAAHTTVEAGANPRQCAELRGLLAQRAVVHAVIFGGDVNRASSCAPRGFWTRTDRSARQDPGSQQVYGTALFRSPSARVLPAAHTDHDVLVVRGHRTAIR